MTKAINLFSTVLVTMAVILALLLVAPNFLGINTYVVLSGSMEPEFVTGSLLYATKNVDAEELEVGDSITFKAGESTIVTHRIIGIVDEDGQLKFQTKGDANEDPDANLVPSENVMGKALFDIPGLGYLADYIQHPPGLYFAVAIGVLLIAFVFISDMLMEDEKKTAKEKKQ